VRNCVNTQNEIGKNAKIGKNAIVLKSERYRIATCLCNQPVVRLTLLAHGGP